MSHQASPIVYKDDYNKNVLGQGPANPAIAFPENDRLKKIHDQTTKVIFSITTKQILKMLTKNVKKYLKRRITFKIQRKLQQNQL